MNPFDQQQAIPGIKKILAIGSGKGGVGKSTVSTNLAVSFKQLGLKVGLLDADLYGPSIPRMLGALNQPPGIAENKKIIPIQRYGISSMSMGYLVEEDSAVIWRGPMLFKAIDQFFKDVIWGELDLLIIDLPPGTGDVALTIAQKVPVNGAVVVSTPQNMALADVKKAIDMFERINIPLTGIIENMASFTPPGSTESYDLFPRGELLSYLDHRRIQKLGTLPFQPKIGLASESGIPYMETEKDSETSLAFQSIAKEIQSQFNTAEEA